jgi:pimeloyl-ACP methyl ester carboxylesterase
MLWQRMDEVTRARLQRDSVIYVPACNEDEEPYPITKQLIEEARQHLILTGEPLPITCPVRLLHGMRDSDVEWQTSTRIAECLKSTDVQVILVKDGEHTMSRGCDLALLTELLDELIEKTNKP